MVNQLPDAFNDSKKVTKSHISVENVSIKINVPQWQIISANEFQVRLKCGRSLGSKDKNFWKKRWVDKLTISDKIQPPEEVTHKEPILEENKIIKNSINFVTSRNSWNRK